MGEAGYKKLIVWQKADELAYQIYLTTKTFPKEEIYGITSQLRKAALSVPTNIVEGYGKQSKNELRQFLNTALGSLAEVEYLLSFSFFKVKISHSRAVWRTSNLTPRSGKFIMEVLQKY